MLLKIWSFYWTNTAFRRLNPCWAGCDLLASTILVERRVWEQLQKSEDTLQPRVTLLVISYAVIKIKGQQKMRKKGIVKYNFNTVLTFRYFLQLHQRKNVSTRVILKRLYYRSHMTELIKYQALRNSVRWDENRKNRL